MPGDPRTRWHCDHGSWNSQDTQRRRGLLLPAGRMPPRALLLQQRTTSISLHLTTVTTPLQKIATPSCRPRAPSTRQGTGQESIRIQVMTTTATSKCLARSQHGRLPLSFKISHGFNMFTDLFRLRLRLVALYSSPRPRLVHPMKHLLCSHTSLPAYRPCSAVALSLIHI